MLLEPRKGSGLHSEVRYYKHILNDARKNSIISFAILSHADFLPLAPFIGKTGNTRKSHRLIQLAGEKGIQSQVVEQLFIAYFESEGDITDNEVLRTAAIKGGLDEADVDNYLATDLGGAQVDKEVALAQTRFIQGVPHFTINGGAELGGAQEPDAFLEIFGSYSK